MYHNAVRSAPIHYNWCSVRRGLIIRGTVWRLIGTEKMVTWNGGGGMELGFHRDHMGLHEGKDKDEKGNHPQESHKEYIALLET